MGSTSTQKDAPPQIGPPKSVRVDDDLWDRFTTAAAARDRKPSQQLRVLMRDFVRDHERNAA